EAICPWCAATLVAPKEIADRSVEGAQRDVIEAQALSDEEQRRAFAKYQTTIAPGVVAVLAGGFAIVIGGIALVASKPSGTPLQPELIAGLLVASVALGVALVFPARKL